MGIIACIILAAMILKFGIDTVMVWFLLIPWQFLPGVNANILFNPWLWLGLLRIAFSLRRVRPKWNWRLFCLVILPPVSYIVGAFSWGIRESSLLSWTAPCLILAISFWLLPPNAEKVRGNLVLVGGIFAFMTILEFLTDLSLNTLLAASPSVSDYLRGSRALGPAGNPLFTSAVLLVSFFAVPNNGRLWNVLRVIIVIAIIATGSKSALLGLCAGLVFAIWKLGLRNIFGFVLIGASTAIIAVSYFPSQASSILRRFTVFENLREADPDRAFATRLVLERVEERPFGGAPIGTVLREKQLFSPVPGGNRFGIESSWLAMISDVGLVAIILIAVALLYKLLAEKANWAVAGLVAFFVSLFFWNGLFGAWVVIPLWVLLATTAQPNAVTRNARIPQATLSRPL